MLYKISTSGMYYKEGPHTRRLTKIGFEFKHLPSNHTMRSLKYDCCLVYSPIIKNLSSDDVIKLSNKHRIIIYGDEIKIYDGYIE